MILSLVQRVMHLETQFKQSLQEFRDKIGESNEKISMPNYENLYNAKKLSLKKLIGNVSVRKSNIIEIQFDSGKLKKMQAK